MADEGSSGNTNKSKRNRLLWTWASAVGCVVNVMLGKDIFTCLTGAGSLVPVHRKGLCLFAGESFPLLGKCACDGITQGAGASRLQLLHTALCNDNSY